MKSINLLTLIFTSTNINTKVKRFFLNIFYYSCALEKNFISYNYKCNYSCNYSYNYSYNTKLPDSYLFSYIGENAIHALL